MSIEEGKLAYAQHKACKVFDALCPAKNCAPAVAAKMFLPPLVHDDIDRNLARPIPKGRAEWIEGYRQAQAEGEEP